MNGQIVYELDKLNSTLERIEKQNEKNNAYLHEVVDYINSQSFYDADDNDIKKNQTNVQLAMIIQSLKRIEQSLSEK